MEAAHRRCRNSLADRDAYKAALQGQSIGGATRLVFQSPGRSRRGQRQRLTPHPAFADANANWRRNAQISEY